MKTAALIFLILVGFATPGKWLKLKRWTKNTHRGVSLAVNTASFWLYTNVVVNAHNGEFLLLPKDFIANQNATFKIMEDIDDQETLEEFKYGPEEEKMKNINLGVIIILALCIVGIVSTFFPSCVVQALCFLI